MDFITVYHQRWCQPYGCVMSGFSEKTVLAQNLSIVVSVNLQVVLEFNSDEKSSPSDFFEQVTVYLLKLVLE